MPAIAMSHSALPLPVSEVSELGEPAESEMNEPLYDYDPASALEDPESIVVFMLDAFETGNSAYVAQALRVVARAKGTTHLTPESSTDDLSFLRRSPIGSE